MTTSATGTYRRLIKLPDGARLLLRPLTVDDRAALLDLYTAAEPADLHSLRHDVTDPEVVNSWLDDLDYQRVFPLLAIINDRVVGNATLHRPGGPFRHIGELRIFLAKDFRRRGLGTEMLQTLVELARKEGLHQLRAEVFASQPKIIRAFESLGFKRQCILEDYFMRPDGQTEDIVLLLMRLLDRVGEF
jgi:RimJ/RimL family protein N-acetyltransferase